jgi:phage shock protein PspC (stress-responsive transcriptional regulator)
MTATPLPDPPSSELPSPDRPPPPPAPSWQPAPPPPAAAYQHRPPLRRSTTNKVLGGVCGGLAEYTGVEALLWRVGFVALALIGAGILVYPLLWILVPAGPDAPVAPRVRETLQEGRAPRPPKNP